MLNVIARIKDKMRQWEIHQKVEIQRLRDESDERSKKFISTMVHDMFRQRAEDKEEFGFTGEFLGDYCESCGNGHKTHREIMREKGLSGKHDLAKQYPYECFHRMAEARKRREKWKFWKRP